MSFHAYHMSREVSLAGYPFYALIMAAMRQADTDNLERLKVAFPETWAELLQRYNAPGGLLPGEKWPIAVDPSPDTVERGNYGVQVD